MNAPTCPNFLERCGCEYSNTFVAMEKDDSFVIQCRTCRGINVFPKSKAEGKGRYDAELKRQLTERQKQEFFSRKKEYSIPGGR